MPQQKSIPASLKFGCLLTLTIHTSMAAIVMHRSRDVPSDRQYSAATSVLLGEFLKIIVSSFLAVGSTEKSTQDIASTSFKQRYMTTVKTIASEKNGLQLILPAALYVCQNFFQIIAVSTISPLVYQTVSQTKIIVIAFLSVLLMKRQVSSLQWFSILILLLGIRTVRDNDVPVGIKMESATTTFVEALKFPSKDLIKEVVLSPSTRGSLLLILATTFGGLAAVTLERLMKKNGANLWYQNTQLSFFSLIPAAVLVVLDCQKTGDWNFMQNFGFWPWMTVLTRAVGGIVVALVIRYTDSILKSFATSSAIVLSLFASCVFNVRLPSPGLMLGTALVIISSLLYAYIDSCRKKESTIQYSPLPTDANDVEKVPVQSITGPSVHSQA